MEASVEITISCFESETGIPLPIPNHLLQEISHCLMEVEELSNGQVEHSRKLKTSPAMEIVLGLASAGVFTTVSQIIFKYLEKNSGKEIHFRRGEIEIAVKGYKINQVEDILEKLFSASEQMQLSLPEKKSNDAKENL